MQIGRTFLKSLALAAVLGLAALTVPTVASAIEMQACTPGFRQVNPDGFGNRHNLYAWSMEAFNGQLYVGTLNNIDGPQVWRWDGTTWTMVHSRDASTTGNTGFRSMTVFNNHLYVSSVNEAQGAELWRSVDGVDWEAVITGGNGDPNNTSFRGLAKFGQWLYMGVQNKSGTGGKLYRSRDGMRWQAVSVNGLGDVGNHSLHSINVFQRMLYVGTANDALFQVFRSADGLNFTRVVGPGAAAPAGLGLIGNTNAVHLYNFNKRMYIGSANETNGFSVHRTTDGLSYQRIASGGAGDPDANFAWRFQSFDGYLWLATGNFTPGEGKGGGIVRSRDGATNWETMVGPTGTHYGYGFDQPINWGVRTVKELNGKLYFGTAQCWKEQCDPLTTGAEVWEWTSENCQ